MINGFFKYYKSQVVISLLVFLGVTLYLAKNHWGLSISIIAVITSILIAIDKWLWKTKMFSWMFWIDNFSGRYEGEFEYTFRNSSCEIQKGILKQVKIIHQTGSQIKIYSFTKKEDGSPSSSSKNIGISVEKLEGKQYRLIYSYLNDGNSDLTPHYGTEIIKFIVRGNKKYLHGKYFTERLPYQTRGEIKLRWASNSDEHEF